MEPLSLGMRAKIWLGPGDFVGIGGATYQGPTHMAVVYS
jgi:hypothetical protein